LLINITEAIYLLRIRPLEVVCEGGKYDKELTELVLRISTDISKIGFVERKIEEIHNNNADKLSKVYPNSYASLVNS
jgi:hypothetical protein